MMDYATFKAVVTGNILRYFPEEYSNAEVVVRPVMKVNCTKDSLSLKLKDGGAVVPNIYIDDMYEMFRECDDVWFVMSRFSERYVEEMKMSDNFTVPEISKEYAENNVYMVMVNTESNQELLSAVPHREVNDCSVIYRLMVDEKSDAVSSVIITDELASKVGMDEHELFLAARENTKRLFPPKLQSLSSVIRDMMTRDGMLEEVAREILNDTPQLEFSMWMLSNEKGLNGAVNMLYDENLQTIAQNMDDDLFVIPSSIHEVICIPASLGRPEEIAEMVREINMRAVMVEDRLSNQVYYYDKDKRELTMATDTPFKGIDGMVAEAPPAYGRNEPKR